MPITPSAGRATVEDLGTLLRIAIPNRKRWGVLLLDVLLLAIWVVGVVSLVQVGDRSSFMLLALLFWLFWGGMATFSLLMELVGCEIIEVSTEAIAIRWTILGLGRPREYSAPSIARLRLDWTRGEEPSAGGWHWSWSWWQRPANQGWLAFDYGTRPIHFADSVDEAEARRILETIDNRFPAYCGTDEKEANP